MAGAGCLLAVLRTVFPGPTRLADGAVGRLGTGRLLLAGVLPAVGVALLGAGAERSGVPGLGLAWGVLLGLPALLLSVLGAMAAIPHLGATLLRGGVDRSLLARSVVGSLTLGLAMVAAVWALKPLAPVCPGRPRRLVPGHRARDLPPAEARGRTYAPSGRLKTIRERSPTGPWAKIRGVLDLDALAARLAEATDVTSAAETLAAYVRDILPGAAVRVYADGPGDRCATCARARDCGARDRCLHLHVGLGEFALPASLAQRVPRTDPAWAVERDGSPREVPGTAALQGSPDGGPAAAPWILPIAAGGSTVGVLGLRPPPPHPGRSWPGSAPPPPSPRPPSGSCSGWPASVGCARRLLLVSGLGRKAMSFLDTEVLLRNAAEDILRTLGLHNVMIFMREAAAGDRLVLKAQASRYGGAPPVPAGVTLAGGVVGRCGRTGTTEVVADVAEDPDFVRWFPDTKAEIAVPIRIGQVVEGVLNVESDQVARFGDVERLVLETAAGQLAIAIENARLFGLLRAREDRYRSLVESNPGAVLHLDASGAIVFANPAAARLVGRPADALVGPGTTLLELADERSRPALERAVQAALAGEASAGRPLRRPPRRRRGPLGGRLLPAAGRGARGAPGGGGPRPGPDPRARARRAPPPVREAERDGLAGERGGPRAEQPPRRPSSPPRSSSCSSPRSPGPAGR